jgi:fatty acid desaturase
MKDKINFLVKFLILTLVLFLIWIPVGKVYLLLLAWVSKYVLLIMGYNAGLVVPNGAPMLFVYYGHVAVLDNAHLMNFNIIPLVALILATPRIETARRIVMLVIGVFVLFCVHVIDLVSHFTDYEIIVIFMAVGEVAVPFMLWFVLAHKEILGNE